METRELYVSLEKQNNSLFGACFLAEKMPVWNPFGRPGAGAPNPNENQARISVCFLILANSIN